ncbi:ROK family protein [Paenibacillus eucommiae]|uniref:NBD/HSP70 family sugar kinase n=1 Tax=Paenibacillus eucommiae TaxID=1355755 RepID=A0ABS4J1V6_9BACL|nr:ROK family protein [Paenibacillus eucommiae]MBP1993798.1 putative NBD/HSP70 family sugar kinase [Paenibacillus eucommiae]
MRDLTGRPGLLKKINVAKIMDLIRKQGPISRADLASALGISRPTVSKLITDLLQAEAIVEIGEGQSNGGKKPILLQINSKNAYVIGIHVTYPTIQVALADNIGTMLTRKEISADGSTDIIGSMIETILALLEAADLEASSLSAIGVAIAGIVNPQSGEIIQARVFPNLQGTEFKDALESKFGVPVWMDNDVYMGLWGQAASSEIRERSIAFVSIGELIGLGMMIEGKLYRGAKLAAGEIGDMIVDSRQQLADGFEPAGGYLEKYLNWKGTNRLFSAMESMESIGELTDEAAMRLLSQYQTRIACCLANVICVFDPERVVIGGEILRLPGSFLEGIDQQLRNLNSRSPRLEEAYYREDSELVGSIYYALQNVHKDLIDYSG